MHHLRSSVDELLVVRGDSGRKLVVLGALGVAAHVDGVERDQVRLEPPAVFGLAEKLTYRVDALPAAVAVDRSLAAGEDWEGRLDRRVVLGLLELVAALAVESLPWLGWQPPDPNLRRRVLYPLEMGLVRLVSRRTDGAVAAAVAMFETGAASGELALIGAEHVRIGGAGVADWLLHDYDRVSARLYDYTDTDDPADARRCSPRDRITLVDLGRIRAWARRCVATAPTNASSNAATRPTIPAGVASSTGSTNFRASATYTPSTTTPSSAIPVSTEPTGGLRPDRAGRHRLEHRREAAAHQVAGLLPDQRSGLRRGLPQRRRLQAQPHPGQPRVVATRARGENERLAHALTNSRTRGGLLVLTFCPFKP